MPRFSIYSDPAKHNDADTDITDTTDSYSLCWDTQTILADGTKMSCSFTALCCNEADEEHLISLT